MIARFISIAAALMLLAACSHTDETSSRTLPGSARRRRWRRRRIGSTDTTGSGSRSELGAGGRRRHAGPGTQADLEVNVGDRVFFGLDSSTLDEDGPPDGRAAGGMAAAVPDRDRDHRGPYRPARHHRIQSGARASGGPPRSRAIWDRWASIPAAF